MIKGVLRLLWETFLCHDSIKSAVNRVRCAARCAAGWARRSGIETLRCIIHMHHGPQDPGLSKHKGCAGCVADDVAW